MWGASGLICPIMDARRRQVYTGLYQMEQGIHVQMEQQAMGRYEVAFKGTDHKYTLFVFGSTQLVNQAVEALGQILPWMLLTVFAVSLLIALFYSRYLSKPVQKLGAASDKMANLDFSVGTDMKRIDEIGVLSRSLDTMAESLDQALSSLWEANAKLKDEMEQERELEQQRMEFFAAASHELKTPIALIQGYAEGLQEGMGEDKESRDYYCDVIVDEAGKMNKMVKQLLTLSSLESGSDRTVMERFDLTELIQGVINSARIMVQQAEAEVKFECSGPVWVWADEFKIEEVVTNYLSNAIHHAGGEKKIVIRITRDGD